jgi:hypothetical protein
MSTLLGAKTAASFPIPLVRSLGFLLCPMVLAGILLAPGAASAADGDFVFCNLHDSYAPTSYYSDVFSGDSKKRVDYQDAFHTYLEAHYPGVVGDAVCDFWGSESRARRQKDEQQTTDRTDKQRIMETGWKY